MFHFLILTMSAKHDLAFKQMKKALILSEKPSGRCFDGALLVGEVAGKTGN